MTCSPTPWCERSFGRDLHANKARGNGDDGTNSKRKGGVDALVYIIRVMIINEHSDDGAKDDDEYRHEFIFLFEKGHRAASDRGVDLDQLGLNVCVLYPHVDGDFF